MGTGTGSRVGLYHLFMPSATIFFWRFKILCLRQHINYGEDPVNHDLDVIVTSLCTVKCCYKT